MSLRNFMSRDEKRAVAGIKGWGSSPSFSTQVIFCCWFPGSPWTVVSRRLLIPTPKLRKKVSAEVVGITTEKMVCKAGRGGAIEQNHPGRLPSASRATPCLEKLTCVNCVTPDPCLLAFNWVQCTGDPGRRSEDGKREAGVFLPLAPSTQG